MDILLRQTSSRLAFPLLLRQNLGGSAALRKASGIAANERLWRSFLYVPGDKDQKITKIANLCNTSKISSSVPDIVVLDCEDAVSIANKELARKTIATFLQGRSFERYHNELHRSICVRINPPSSGLAGDDLHVILSAVLESMKSTKDAWFGPDYIAVPKVEAIGDLQWVETQVMKIFSKYAMSPMSRVSLVGMIESVSSLVNMRSLCAAAPRVLKLPLSAMVFGSDDYCASLGVSHSKSKMETLFARQYMLTVCKAFGLPALDVVDADLRDLEGFRQECLTASQLGYDGKQLIHPQQIESANELFSPSPERIEWARELVEAASLQAGCGGQDLALRAGAFAFRGQMVDRPLFRQAKRVVALAKLMTERG